MSPQPLVSIVIATRNRERLLRETLVALSRLDWPRDRYEILVADNGSIDGTAGVVGSMAALTTAPIIRYLHVSEPGKSFAVNAALTLAAGEIIALTDDDVVPDPGWLRGLCDAFAETGADFVAGRILPRWEAPPPRWMSPALHGVLAIPDNGERRLPITPGAPHVVPIGANMAVRASVIAHLGGLRTDLGKLEGTLRTGEDHEFFLRMLDAGYRGVYEPRAVVQHWVSRDRLERDYFRRWLYQNGQDVARLESSRRTDAVPRLLGVPRYLWRQAAGHAATCLAGLLRGDPARRFAGEVRLLWFAGYLREAWRRQRARSPRVPSERRQPKAAV